MTNSLTMFKLETMIYASEDGTNSVFTLNSALQKQLDALATQHPEVCQRKSGGDAGGVTYQVRNVNANILCVFRYSLEISLKPKRL